MTAKAAALVAEPPGVLTVMGPVVVPVPTTQVIWVPETTLNERTGVPLIQQKQGTDPAAVLFDSLKAAKARGSDVLIVDTAGRLHTKSNLMAELEKMRRPKGRHKAHPLATVVAEVTGMPWRPHGG